MAFKTFEDLDKEAGAQSIYEDYAKVSQRPDGGGYLPIPAPTFGDTISAAFRTDNFVGSLFSRDDIGRESYDDGEFDALSYIQENNLQGYEDEFSKVLNRRYADGLRDHIKREEADRQTLAVAGWSGTIASIGAGVFDLPTLIPGTVAVRGAKGGWSVGKSVLLAGTSSAATQAGTEGLLHLTQETRTAEESLVNVGAAAVLGSLLGGGVAAALGRSERKAAETALENIADINAGLKPNTVTGDLSAALADGAFYVDPVDVLRSRSELSVEGKAANVAVDATSWFNPVLRGTQRYAASARQFTSNIYESTIYKSMHSAGETTGAAVETNVRVRVEASQAEAFKAASTSYREMRAGGVRMTEEDFYSAVGVAMRNKDESDNPFVARAAQAYRKLFDEFTNDALKLGLLGEDGLDVKTAASYFSRVYDKDRLLASEPDFLDTIGRHFAERMQAAYKEDAAELAANRALYLTRLEDVQLAGPERAQRIDALRAQGEALDARYSYLNDTVDELSEARSALRGGDATARDRIKAAQDKGGAALQEYLTQRAELRARMRNLAERNADAQLAKGEELAQRMDSVQEFTERSLASFAKRARNLLNEIQAKPVQQAEEQLASARSLALEAQAKVERTQDYIGKLKEKGIEAEADKLSLWKDRLAKHEKALAELIEDFELQDDAGVAFAQARVQKLEALLASVTEGQAERTLRRGQYLRVLQDRASKLAPEAVAKRAASQKSQFYGVLSRRKDRFDARWGEGRAMGLERNEKYDFEAAGRAAAKEIYDKLTGKGQQREDIPSFVTKITSGPLKDRTFMVPDEMLAGKSWLRNDVREVANRYARAMAGEVELTRRFGRADMQDQLAQVAQEYSELRVRVNEASSVQEVNAVLGRDKYKTKLDLEKVKLDAQQVLSRDEASAVEDMKAGRDMLRGSYLQGVNNTNFASVTRSLMGFNYLRQMGGVMLANVTDFYRPAMVHGLEPYLRAMPDAVAQAFGKGSKGLQLSMEEAKRAGLITQRITHSMMQANGDVLDPFMSRTTHIERFMHKATTLASRWNLINAFTDAQQTIASTVSQHRILEAALGNKGDGTFLNGDGERLLRMLGISKQVQGDIAKLFNAHGQTVDGIRVANTEKWLQAANETGVAAEVARAEAAVRAYRAALSTDVNSIVSRRGMGDTPLFANHPLGKMLAQFSGYAMGAHSRVMIRGLQESHARLVGGLIAVTTLGAMTSYLAAWRGGRERWDKYVDDTAKNPALLIGEGMDRSGFFPLLFDVANRAERVSGSIGYQYRFNPVKSPIALLGGGKGALGITSTRASDSAAVFGALLGPTAGLVDSGIAAARVGVDVATGEKPPKRDVNQALAVVPYQSYYGVREMLQVLTGNSPYTRH